MIETAATLTDEIIDLNDRLIGSFFTKSKHKYERAFAEQGKAINDKVRLYAKVGAALVDARELRSRSVRCDRGGRAVGRVSLRV